MTPQAAPGSGRRGRVIRESREGTRIKRNFSGRSFAAIRVIRGLLSLAQKGNETAPYLGRGARRFSVRNKRGPSISGGFSLSRVKRAEARAPLLISTSRDATPAGVCPDAPLDRQTCNLEPGTRSFIIFS